MVAGDYVICTKPRPGLRKGREYRIAWTNGYYCRVEGLVGTWFCSRFKLFNKDGPW
jgi:hypothetical protein